MFAVLALLPLVVSGQRSDSLYVNPTLLVSSARLTALAGASVGLGEGAESLSFNYASVAQRNPKLRSRWDVGFSLSLLTTPFDGLQDLDNDERPLAGSSRPATETSARPLEGNLSFSWQYGRVGVGAFGRLSTRALCFDGPCSRSLSSSVLQGGVVAGMAFFLDQLVVGLGLNVSSVQLADQTRTVQFIGQSFGFGVLVRPFDVPWRLGLSILTQHSGAQPEGAPTELAGRPLFKGVVTPTRASLGLAWRFGDGAPRFNRASQALVNEQPQYKGAPLPPHDDLDDVPPGRVLLTVQLDTIFPVSNATTPRAFLFDETPAAVAGAALYLVPRAGVEVEALEKRLRLRGGSWLEPNLVAGSTVRPHFTGGAEVFLLHLWRDWSASAAFDVAPRYLSASVGLGFWN